MSPNLPAIWTKPSFPRYNYHLHQTLSQHLVYNLKMSGREGKVVELDVEKPAEGFLRMP